MMGYKFELHSVSIREKVNLIGITDTSIEDLQQFATSIYIISLLD